MIDYKQKYNELYRTMLAITILLVMTLILFILGNRVITSKINEKDEKIWQQETEIESLKEQIYILSNGEE